MQTLISSPHILAATKLAPETLIYLGVIAVLVVSSFTYSNWRLGVKIAFVMVLYEGAIRKWALPQAQELAYFIKDILLIGAYVRFYYAPPPELRAWRIRAPIGLIILLCAIISFSALNPNIGSLVLALYGLKIYLFYLPLAFMMPYLFRTRDEMANGLFWYAMLATPICLLAIAQFAMPGDNFLNVNAQGGEGVTMGSAEMKIRVTGTFSYISGFATFVAFFFALHLALLLNKQPKWRWVALLGNVPLLFGAALMSGSRSAVATMLFVCAGFALLSFLGRLGVGGKGLAGLVAVAIISLVGVSMFFVEARDQFLFRFHGAQRGGETVQFRAYGMAIESMSHAASQGGMFGYGIGMTHPALERLRNALRIPRPRAIPPVFDVELSQVFVELGFFGWVAWYFLRVLILIISIQGFRNTETGLLKTMILASILIQMPHFSMSVVLNHTANFLIFGSFGICLIPLVVPSVSRGRSLRPSPLPDGPERVPSGGTLVRGSRNPTGRGSSPFNYRR